MHGRDQVIGRVDQGAVEIERHLVELSGHAGRENGQAENEDPQPQVWVALGFWNLNPPPLRLFT